MNFSLIIIFLLILTIYIMICEVENKYIKKAKVKKFLKKIGVDNKEIKDFIDKN